MKVKVWYAVSNNGDGSASVCFFKKEAHAEAYERFQEEETGEGWAEPSVSSVEFSVDSETGEIISRLDPIGQDEDYNDIYPED